MRTLLRKLYLHGWVLPRAHKRYSKLDPVEVFRHVYATKRWGSRDQQYFSGSGSGGLAAEEYCRVITEFIRARGITTIADLGCGDFRIGRRIVGQTGVNYVGVDIVPELVEHCRARFSNDRIRFECADITRDPLPRAELCLVRQVLQHLSNSEVEAALQNIAQYGLALISEHVPVKARSFNRDKTHGPDIRAYFGSGVYPDKPPFDRKPAAVWETGLEPGAVLRTMLIMGGNQK